MLCLAIEASTIQGSVALCEDEVTLFDFRWRRQKSHSELITKAIDDALGSSGKTFADLDRIAVDAGPGSFTGVRVAVNAAKALSYSTQKPIYVGYSLDILAESAPKKPDRPLVVAINAYQNKLYWAKYELVEDAWNKVVEPTVSTLEEFEERIDQCHICVGDGFDYYFPVFSKNLADRLIREPCEDLPLAKSLALMSSRAKLEELIDWRALHPNYLRKSTAEERQETKNLVFAEN
jgi:tRNA threonylcarbamoyladenosine biosynthesis protein TsaB